MNDMAAKFDVTDETVSRRVRVNASEATGHEFRSRLLNKTALIEQWAVDVVRRSSQSADTAMPKKLPHLFGKRLEAVRRIAEAKSPTMKKPATVLELLDRVRPYTDLRSALAHSVLQVAIDERDEPIFIFTHASETSAAGLPQRTVFTTDEMSKLLRDLAQLANSLTQQKCRN